MSRSAVSLASSKFVFIIALLSILAISLSGCGEDSFTGDGNPNPDPNPNNTPGGGTTPPTTGAAVYFGIAGANSSFLDGVLDVGVTGPLSARGTTTITGYLIDDLGNTYTTPKTFNFSSRCVANGTASIDTPVTSVNGVVRATYRAEGCVGTDTIVATETAIDNPLSASGSLTIAPAAAGAIEFVSADPETIALQGTSGVGLTETSTVTFKVVDNASRPVAGVNVNFSLSTDIGGITLDRTNGDTGDNGTVQVSVSSGTVNTSARVVATVNTGTTTVSTQSVALAISTGIPDSDSFEIVATKLRPHTWSGECSGEEVTITAFASDHFNNPAPDGTAVAFQTEGGFIQGSCLMENGQCSVTWTGTNPRPSDGRATVTATVIGEESYFDTSPSNGRFDDGETFIDLPEAFYDFNENGVWDPNEEFIDYNSDDAYNVGDGQYNGVLCTPGATDCNTDSPVLTLSANLVLVMASRDDQVLSTYQDDVLFDPDTGNILLPDDGSTTDIRFEYQDSRGQQPPTGSSISVSTTTGKILGGTSTDITDNSEPGPASLTVTLRSTGNNLEDGVLTVSLDMPDSKCGSLTVNKSISVVIDDVTSPSVTSTTPANNATNVAVDGVISVEFDDNINAATFITSNTDNTDTIQLVNGNTFVSISARYDAAQRRVTITPDANLAFDTVYTLILTSGIQDDSPNANPLNPATISFRTEPDPAAVP
ncbi:MAG: Ig-like domain-containing protein [Gammaproteobacteria bacterium]